MISIIGAGLGGLSLAQGLKKANIPFRVFECDSSASFRGQGYRIRISADAGQSLKRLLPAHLWSAFEATCSELRDNGHQLDAISGTATRWASGPPKEAAGQTKAYNADRAILRNILLSGVGEQVDFGKRLQGYSSARNGGLSLDFAQHSSEQADLLVGADGVRSAVRHQRMPALGLVDTEGRAIFGKTPITPGFFDRVPPELGQGLSLIGESSDSRIKLFCDVMCFDHGKGSEVAESLGLRLPDDYLYWVLVFRKDAVKGGGSEQNVHALTPQQSAEKALELTAHWHQRIRNILIEQDPTAASTITFLAAKPQDLVTSWTNSVPKSGEANGAVTLLGDAAHPMPPVGGFGANAAFQDAAALCDALCKADGDDAADRAKHMRLYEEDMRTRAESVVQRSVTGSGRFFGMRPVDELKPAAS
ncbi:hypothetical protein LTR36_006264 [Oleoguttula mirabilis]|uniref:FAD-binding domain-containing protein n=1 Tax=Oleoguttula mirabilis TaxID=1507867 RepID=A0AAV9JE67_9PEZI|nr:hypothetical protein LTR36_006264 [Oleoguttula mirabilis]